MLVGTRNQHVVTIADDYDAMTSAGPERAYKAKNLSPQDAAVLLRKGAEWGRYEPRITEIFIADVLRPSPAAPRESPEPGSA